MEIYRVTRQSKDWLLKAYDYARMDAFVFGQNIPLECEFDHDDPDEDLEAVVLIEDHKPLAGCRITYPKENAARIGRVCVIREKQRSGVGHILLAEAEKWIREKGIRHVLISSQDRAQGFYERCGYHLVPGVDPDILEGNRPREQKEEEKKDRPSLGFSCVLVEKYLD